MCVREEWLRSNHGNHGGGRNDNSEKESEAKDEYRVIKGKIFDDKIATNAGEEDR